MIYYRIVMHNNYDIIFANKGLSLERLALLCKVTQHGGIRAAIGNDPIRHSLASRQLKELGEYSKIDLTKRVGRGIEITESGIELAEIANDFFTKMYRFIQKVQNLPTEFNLGVGDSIFQWNILPIMSEFSRLFPSIKLISFSYSAIEIIKAVEMRQLHAGIVRTTALGDNEVSAKRIGEIRYKMFVSTDLLRSVQDQKAPAIPKLPFCTLTGDGEYASAMNRFLSSYNTTAALNCSSMTQIYAAVQSGQYAAILPAKAESNKPSPSLKAFTLPELSSFTRQISLIFKSDLKESPEMASVLDFLSTCINHGEHT